MKSSIICLFIIILFASLSLMAENERHIHINGEHLDHANIQLLDKLVGNLVGDGYYWLNMQTGQWGFEGNNQIQGVISSIANQQQMTANGEQHQNLQNETHQNNNSQRNSSDTYNEWEGVSSTGSVTSGRVNGQECTYVSVQGMTMKSCD